MSNRQTIESTAATWVVRKSEGLSTADRARLEAWLEAAPEHRLAMWRLEYGWKQAERLSALRNPETVATVLAAPNGSRRLALGVDQRRLFAVAASIVFAIGLGVVAWPRPVVFETETGERQQLTLEDGSRLDLNTRTRLRAEMSSDIREAWLDEGEAYFSIAREPGRPFVLHMGDRTVRVLGTRFIARRHGDQVSVTVAEGRVRVDTAGVQAGTPLILTAGDAVATEGGSLIRHHETPQSIDAELSWRGGQLVFDQVSLNEAASEFNRYNETQIHIADASTGAIRIGGTFEAGNVDAFVRLLGGAYGLQIVREGDTIVISE